MNKKEKILKALKKTRIFMAIYNWALSIFVLVELVSIWKELNLILYILIAILGAITILETILFIMIITKMIKIKENCSRFCTSFANAVNEVDKLHRERYKCYLSGDTESGELGTKCIQENVPKLIKYTEIELKEYGFSQKQKEQIRNGIEDLQYMLNNIQPKNRTLK